LFDRASRLFLRTTGFLPVVDDPHTIPNLPGYPLGDMIIVYLNAYKFSICIRDEFIDRFDWDDHETGPEIQPPDYDQLIAQEWLVLLFRILAARWGWMPIFERYPILFRDSVAELSAFIDEHDFASRREEIDEAYIKRLKKRSNPVGSAQNSLLARLQE